MNLQAMQVTSTKNAEGKLVRNAPRDTNTAAMAMGSWHARLSKGGELSPRKRAKLARGSGDGGIIGAKKGGKK